MRLFYMWYCYLVIFIFVDVDIIFNFIDIIYNILIIW